MYKLSTRVLLVLGFICMLTTASLSQDSFEGKIVYSITYIDLPPEQESMRTMLPSTSVMFLKNSRSAIVQDGEVGKTTIVYDQERKTNFVLMDLMGQKVAIKSTEADFAEKEAKKSSQEIVYLDETKVIAGYTCHKAQISSPGQTPVTVYYTTEIPVNGSFQFSNGLKGFPLFYEINENGLSMIMTAIEVAIETVAEEQFSIPDGYDVKTSEEMRQILGR